MEKQILSSSCLDDGSVIISSGKRLTIEDASDFVTSIRAALTASKRVAVQFDAEVELDIIALQILCSACKTAAAEGKTFFCFGEQPKAMADLIEACGAGFDGVCKSNTDRACNWFGERK
ncbi:MAG: hypothetical protein HY885_00720 [Deltaproteobacteria bacterium]|nr:hypothetical protein [Deltaproteobacteria bacterium]